MFIQLNSCSILSLYLSLALVMSFLICLFNVLTVFQSSRWKALSLSFIVILICGVIQGLELGYFLNVLVGIVDDMQNFM